MKSAAIYKDYSTLMQSDFITFAMRCFYELHPGTDYQHNWHIEVMAAELEACRQGRSRRLVINVPPRHLKSLIASAIYPAWLLGQNPSAQIICASYGHDLADKHARDCRRIMTSAWYQALFQRTRLVKNTSNELTTTLQGCRYTTSVYGPTTGRGADTIIIDDPLKPEEALSGTLRDGVNEWFGNTLMTRLNSKKEGCIILIMQRLHQDDLTGYVLSQKEKWKVLSLAAIAETDEAYTVDTINGRVTFTRRAGEALHPERESLETLAMLRSGMGEYNFSSQYLQAPAPPGGALIKTKWLRYYLPGEYPAKFDRIVQSWDTANKAGELNDYSVCTTWGEKDGRFYLLHVFRRRMEYPDLKRAIRDQAKVHDADIILIEDKASGTQLIQELIADGMSGIVRCEPPPCDKVMRLNSQSAAFENGLVLLPKEEHWLADYVKELTGFPGCKHDDQVDSTTQALTYLRKPMQFYRIRSL